MIEYLIDNKEWIFSGIGVSVIGLLLITIRYFYTKKLKPKKKFDESIRLNERGIDAYNKGWYREAFNYFQQLLVITREIGDRARESKTLNNIGNVYQSQGKYEQALQMYKDALVIVREVGNRTGEGVTLNGIGNVYRSQGKYEQALQMYKDALVIVREVSDRAKEGTALNNIGNVYQSQGKYEQALDCYNQDLVIAVTLGIKPLEKTVHKRIETLSPMNETKIEEPAIEDKNKRLNQLRKLYAQHTNNLQKLKEQAAIYGAGQTPLHLINQLEAEKKAIEELQLELENLIND